MSLAMASVLLFGIFFVLLAIGVPVAISLIISAVISSSSLMTVDLSSFIACQKMIAGVDSFSLLAVPFFILCGVMMNSGGIAARLIDFAKVLTGRMPSGLTQTNILGNAIFGTLSGSSVAASIAVGGVLIPREVKEGYPLKFAAAANIASAPAGLLIPPSGILIIYPVLCGCSVVGMIMAGYIPGLLWCLACMLVAFVIGWRNGYKGNEHVTFPVFCKAFINAIPSLMLIFIIIGGISSGVFTATESAAVAVAYTMFLALVCYRSIKLKDLPKIFCDTCETTAIILFLIAGSSTLSFVMSFTGLPQTIGAFLMNLSDNPYIILLFINVVLLCAGTFLDIAPAVVIFTPIFLPVVESFGMHPIHFGIMMVMNLCIGNITPPVGSALFSGCSVAKLDMDEMVKPLMPFYIVLFLALLLVSYVPWFSMVLPELIGAV